MNEYLSFYKGIFDAFLMAITIQNNSAFSGTFKDD